MASDSEPRKFFCRPPRGPLRSHISGSKKPVRLLTQFSFLVHLTRGRLTILNNSVEK